MLEATKPKLTLLDLHKNRNIKNTTFQFASSNPTYYRETDSENRDNTPQDICHWLMWLITQVLKMCIQPVITLLEIQCCIYEMLSLRIF